MTETANFNLLQVMDAFDTDQECRNHLERLRWRGAIRCPRCQSDKISRIRERKQFDCDSCRYQFSVTAGTIFNDSHLPLPKWFLAVYLMTESKKGISAMQMKRTLGVSYQTAWHLCHRIRHAMSEVDPEPVRGDVHTNTVEGTFSLFKQSIIGSFHRISAKHLDRYLNEFEWRFNNRRNKYLFRDTLTRLVNSEKLEYKTLTAS